MWRKSVLRDSNDRTVISYHLFKWHSSVNHCVIDVLTFLNVQVSVQVKRMALVKSSSLVTNFFDCGGQEVRN